MILSIPGLFKAKKLDREGKRKERTEFSDRIVREMSKKFLYASGAKIVTVGKENVPKSGPVLFVSNHQSYFDILILLACVPRAKGFIAKDDLARFPILKQWMENINCVFIERGNPRKGLEAINKGIQLLKEGYSLVLFPEGTRSKDGQLLEFKAGSLKLATKSKVPLVPIAIDGAYKIMPRGKIRVSPAEVKVTIGEAIYFQDDEKVDSTELADRVRKIIASYL